MMMVFATYVVRWTAAVATDSGVVHEHQIELRVSENDLDAFLHSLRFNGVPEFSARREGSE